MDRTYINVLKKRKDELQNELDYINNILLLYSDIQDIPVKSDSNRGIVTANKSNATVKETVIKIINDLGGEIYVSDLSRELQKLYPERKAKAINNQARNYVHILKNEKILVAEQQGKNKWLYRIVK